MLLSEIGSNETINIQFSLNEKQFDFESKVLGSLKGFILIEPIIVNEKILNFGSTNIATDIVYNRENDKPILWRHAKLNLVHSKNGAKYCVKDVLGKEINRRSAFRTFIGLSAKCQIGCNTKPEEVIIKDVSTAGFSFVVDNNEKINNKQNCHITFEDSMLGYFVSLNGIIERIQKIDENKFICGCKLIREYNGLDEYVNIKQREQLAKSSEMINRFDYKRYKHVRVSIK